MPFGDGRSWVLPWQRVSGVPCEEVGDTTAGSTSNIKTIIDNVRRYRGNVADTTALAALTGNTNGDVVLLLNNGSSVTEWRRFNSTGSTWDVVGGGGGALTNSAINGTLTATAAASTPTTFFGTSATDCVFVATSNGLVLNSNEHAIVNIDSNNGGTAAEFRVNINAQSATGGTNVFKVTEAGNVTATGTITATNILPSGNVTLTTTAAASTPTSFIGTAATDCFFVATSNGAVINGAEHVICNIDSNNSGTTGEFRVNINSQSATGGTTVFRVAESGAVSVTGALDVSDKLVHINKSFSGTNIVVPTSFSGVLIDRGDVAGTPRAQAGVLWDEANARFTVGTFTNDTTLAAEADIRFANSLATGAVGIGTTTAGSSPSSYVGFSSTNGLYVESGVGNTIINAIGSAQIIIDADNNSTAQTFKVRTNSPNTSGGSDLLTVTEAGDVTISGKYISTSGVVSTVRVLTSGASTTLALTDDILIINKTVGSATTVNLPTSPATGLVFVIKDGKGDALTNNITIDPAGATTIDGQTTLVLDGNYVAVSVVYNGTEWNVF